jgi:hypothetical protein
VHTSLMMCIGVRRVFEDEVHILLLGLHFDVVVILACSSRIAPSTDSDLGFRFFSCTLRHASRLSPAHVQRLQGSIDTPLGFVGGNSKFCCKVCTFTSSLRHAGRLFISRVQFRAVIHTKALPVCR